MQNKISLLSVGARKRYQRHLSLPEIGLAGQLKLANASVLCIGAGGLGTPVLSYLAAAGVGRLGIVDHDIIELSNLQRQIFFATEDLGKSKAQVLADKLKLLNPEIALTAYPCRFTIDNAASLLADYALVVDCSDNFATRYLVNDICYAAGKPFVCASVERFSGQVSFFSGVTGPCYRCLYPYPIATGESISRPNCAEAGVLGVVCGLIGSIQATEAIKYFTQVGQCLSGELFTLDSLTMHVEKFKLSQLRDCPVCVEHLPVSDLPRPSLATTCQQDFISLAELKAKLAENTPLNLVDVREADEHARFNIGGKLLPLSAIETAEFQGFLAKLDKTLLTVLYCQSGLRSQKAFELLRSEQFADLKMLAGGIKEW